MTSETVADVLAEMQRMAKRWVVASSDEMETFATRIAAAHAREVGELVRDAERLDYIERTFKGMTNCERYLTVTMGWGKSRMGRTLREACDKYMKRDAATGEPVREVLR